MSGWHIRVRENWYRDVWLLLITGVVLLALATGHDTAGQVQVNQRADTRALCAFRSDLQRRLDEGVKFLKSHPNGIPGIPAPVFQVSLDNERRTLVALSPLRCRN